jgi:hypothetical protein
MKRYLSFLSMVLTAWLSGLPHVAMADAIPEYEMKAAYLYHFATFTDWPVSATNSTPNNTVRLCILGNDNFGGALEKLTRNQSGDMRITLSYLANIKEVNICQMLFINTSELKNAADIINKLDKSPILTVTDSDDLFHAGVMIGLFLDNKRLVFDVDYTQTKNAQLNMSSKLLRVARKVTK